jgi:hypothetical protein
VLRKIFGSIGLLSFLAAYVVGAIHVGEMLTDRKIASLIYYLVAGIAWAIPLKPLLQWMHAKDKPLPSSKI